MKQTEYGRSIDQVERAFFGCLLIRPELFFECKDVKPFMFASSLLRRAADEYWALQESGTFSHSLFYANFDQAQTSQLKSIRQDADSSRFFELKDFLKREYLRREEEQIASETLDRLHQGEDPDEVRGYADALRDQVRSFTDDEDESISRKMHAIIDQAYKAMENGSHITGIDTGLAWLNEITGGWQPTDQIIIAGRPGMGKTEWALDLTLNAWRNGVPGLFISLEMSSEQLLLRLQQRFSGVRPDKIRTGRMTAKEVQSLKEAVEKLHDLPVLIVDNVRRLSDIKAAIREKKLKHDIQFFCMDYLQLASISGMNKDNRNVMVGELSNELKGIAKDTKCTSLILSQLSRGVESRGGNKKPMLSDLRDSGSIEQDADMVIFPYRPGYYGITQDEDGFDISGKTEIIIAKNRHGRIGSEWFEYDDKFGCLKDNAPSTQFPAKVPEQIGSVGDDKTEIPF